MYTKPVLKKLIGYNLTILAKKTLINDATYLVIENSDVFYRNIVTIFAAQKHFSLKHDKSIINAN